MLPHLRNSADSGPEMISFVVESEKTKEEEGTAAARFYHELLAGCADPSLTPVAVQKPQKTFIRKCKQFS